MTKFASKILLFGEYSVINQSMALAISYPLFDGELTFPKNSSARANSLDAELKNFCDYLKKSDLGNKVDLDAFEFDVSEGLRFDSTIPQGFGVGSSGALVAAVYDRYQTCDKEKDILCLKEIFSQMESHFHSKSSGFDPLVSYLGKNILIDQNGDLNTVDLPCYKEGKGAIFLLSTGRPRRTEPLVNLYLEKLKNPEFKSICEGELIAITNDIINSFLEGSVSEMTETFFKLSEFQYEHFAPMIPHLLRDLWSQGIESKDYALKLCGAGGGGFTLGIAKDYAKVRESLSQYKLRPLFYL